MCFFGLKLGFRLYMMQKDSLQEVKFCIEGVIFSVGYAALYAEILANKC